MEIYLWLNIIDVGSNLILQLWSLGFFLKRLEIWTFCGSSCEFQNSTRQVGYTIFGFRPTLAQIDIIEIRVLHSFLLPFIQSIWSKQQKHIYLFLNQILFFRNKAFCVHKGKIQKIRYNMCTLGLVENGLDQKTTKNHSYTINR